MRQTRVHLLPWFDKNGIRNDFQLVDLAIPVIRPREVNLLRESRADCYITNEQHFDQLHTKSPVPPPYLGRVQVCQRQIR